MARDVNTANICVIQKPFWNDKAFRNEVIMVRSFSHMRISVKIDMYSHTDTWKGFYRKLYRS